MLTGTPLDLTPFGALLSGIGWLYWLLAAAGLWWALRGSRPWKSKLLRALPVVLVFGLLPLRGAWQSYQARSKLNASMALFQERCKTAGEKITRTVESVDGVMWMKWREAGTNDHDQFKLDDPYGKDCSGEECIAKLLRATKGLQLDPQRKRPYHRGYAFVESVVPADGKLYRFTMRLDRPFDRDPTWSESYVKPELEKVAISGPSVRYGITWDDLSTREDREHWIAGSSLKVVDLQTNETIASRTGYLIDTGQGDTGGFRSPWGWAQSYGPRCPRVDVHAPEFAISVIQPTKQGE